MRLFGLGKKAKTLEQRLREARIILGEPSTNGYSEGEMDGFGNSREEAEDYLIERAQMLGVTNMVVVKYSHNKGQHKVNATVYRRSS